MIWDGSINPDELVPMRKLIDFQSDSPDQTLALGAALGRRLQSGDLLALEGPLGSGKTCLVRGIAGGLGLDSGSVSSPTFIICQEYSKPDRDLKSDPSITLVHIDAYRLNGPDELETIGWSELIAAPNTIIAVEWPSRIEAALPAERIRIDLAHLGEHSRSIVISAPDSAAQRMENVDLPERSSPHARCRTCGKDIAESMPTFPFCSLRCRMADLGRWFSEGYRLSRPVQANDESEDG